MQEICSSINCKSAPSQVSWSQGGEDVEVHIALPKGVRGRDISVIIKYNLIKFGLKNGHSMTEESGEDEGQSEPTLLKRISTGLVPSDNIDPDASTWTLSDGQLVISLIKRKATMWDDLYVT